MRSGRRSGEAGFTLLEVLVALAVLAVGAALTLSLISGTLGNIRKVQLRTRAVQHAETVMELSLLDDSIRRPTTLTGNFEDGTRWSVVIDEVPEPDEQKPEMQLPNAQRPELPVKLFSYTVEVTAPDSRAPDFRLQTLKVVNIQESERPVRLPR